jgi:hypothetical protein
MLVSVLLSNSFQLEFRSQKHAKLSARYQPLHQTTPPTRNVLLGFVDIRQPTKRLSDSPTFEFHNSAIMQHYMHRPDFTALPCIGPAGWFGAAGSLNGPRLPVLRVGIPADRENVK